MLRSLFLLALFATAADAQTDALEAAFAATALKTEAHGGTVVVAPVVGMSEAFGLPTTHRVDLEAGTEYYLMLACEEGSGLDPDVTVLSPDGDLVATGEDVGEGEVVLFTANTSGTYTLDTVVYECDDSCSYGFMIATQ